MSRITSKSLYQYVAESIEKKIKFSTSSPYSGQLERVSLSTTPGQEGASVAGIIAGIQELLENTLPQTIISGLEVEATTPISDAVIISSGKGSVGGSLYELDSNITLTIPFDNISEVFYIVLYANRVQVDKTYSSNKLTLAKIVVPNPGTTVYVQDDKDSSWNAYIVNFKEYKLYGINDKFEEDTLELMRDNIGDILADNIIGNIRLSENLKILNTAGTLELDSNSVNIYDSSENLLSQFNENGVYFYDTNGNTLSKFTTTGARIGNISILPNYIASTNFVSGNLGAGFKIEDTGDAEFNSVKIRGKLSSSVFEKDTVSTIGGSLLVMDGDILAEDMTALDSSTLKISGDTNFSIGDILRIKDGIDDEWFEVTNISNAPIYTVTRDKASTYSSNDNPTWKKGTSIVNFGQTGEGGIYLTSSESNAPYLSIVTHTGLPWSSLTTHLRLGNLNGFLGYVSDLYGIVIGTTNDYLKYDPTNGLQIKGSITITGGDIPPKTFYQDSEPTNPADDINDGDYWVDTNDSNKLYIYQTSSWVAISSTGSGGITTFSQTSIPTSTSIGDLWLDTNDSNKLYRADSVGADQITSGEWILVRDAASTTVDTWRHISDTTKIDGGTIYTGSITADKITVTELSALTANLGNITAGTVTGATIQTAISGSRIYMDTDTLIAYDDFSGGGNEIFKINLIDTDYTSLLLHFDGSTFIEETDKTVSSHGSSELVTTQSVFGNSSGYFINSSVLGYTEIDYMEYSTDALAQAAYVSSNSTFSDDFSGTLGSWTTLNGEWTISGGITYPSSLDLTNGTISVTSATILNGSATMVLKSQANYSGIVFRGVDVNNFYYAILHSDGNSVRIAKVVSGATTILEIGDVGYYPGSSERTLKTIWATEGAGTRIKVLLDGTEYINYLETTSTFALAGFVGMRFYYGGKDSYAVDGHYASSFSYEKQDLTAYSEATVKNQGVASLKGIASITESLNKTLTKTFSSPLNLTGIDTIKFDIYAGRTGSNIKIGLHDTEIVNQQMITSNSIGANLGNPDGYQYRWAQGFKLSDSGTITAVELKPISHTGSPTGNWTIRIETDGGDGKPSDTLANASASVIVVPPSDGVAIKGVFSTKFTLSLNTQYWIVVYAENQTTGNLWYLAGTTSSVYADGNACYAQSNTGSYSWNILSDYDIYFKIYTDYIKEITPNITSADTFQTVILDISGVSNANKDAIDSIIITVINADADNTFYLDDLYYESYTTENSYLTISDYTSFNLSNDDFTIETRVRFEELPDLSTSTLISQSDIDFSGGGIGWSLSLVSESSGLSWRFMYSTDGLNEVYCDFEDLTITTDIWYHIAIVRSGNNLYCFRDGIQKGSVEDLTGISVFNSSSDLVLGGSLDNNSIVDGFSGWLDETRISQHAIWTAPFSLPTMAYTISLGIGDIVIGDYFNYSGFLYDASLGKFNFRGTLNVGTAGRVYIDGDNEVIKVYDSSNNLMVELGKLT